MFRHTTLVDHYGMSVSTNYIHVLHHCLLWHNLTMCAIHGARESDLFQAINQKHKHQYPVLHSNLLCVVFNCSSFLVAMMISTYLFCRIFCDFIAVWWYIRLMFFCASGLRLPIPFPSVGILPFLENIYVLLHAVLKQINQI
jgi:hypothetical protein